MSQHWLPAKEPGQSLLAGYDRPLHNYFAQLHDAAGDLIGELVSTTNLTVFRAQIEPYLDTTRVALHDVTAAIFMDQYRDNGNRMDRVVDWRDLPVREEAIRYSYGPPQFNLGAESAERAYELQQALDWRESIEFYEGEAKELNGRAAAEHLRQAASLRALVERIEAGPRDLSIDAPALASEAREPIRTVDLDLETSPAQLRQRADAFEARAKLWRERPDRTAEDRRIAYGLERAAAALRDSAQITNPDEPRRRADGFELSYEGTEPVRTDALAANAAEIVRHTTGLQPQQRDRHVVGVRADATGADRDRHGRRFQLDSSEDWTVEKRPGFTFTGPDGQQERADLTIIGRAGTVPVVVATAGHAEQLAAALLTHVFPDRAEAAEPFLLVEHRPEQQRFEHVNFADYRVRNEDHAPRIGDVTARRVVEPGEDLEQERAVEPELTQTPRRRLQR